LKNTVGWFFIREKYCSGWKNKLNKTDYKPDECQTQSGLILLFFSFLREFILAFLNSLFFDTMMQVYTHMLMKVSGAPCMWQKLKNSKEHARFNFGNNCKYKW
jgi:hypothetical protein